MAAKTASLSVNIIADAAKARAGLKEAETAFGKFRREVGEAQGAMGKFKTIGGAALDSVKANAIGFATSAAAAIGAFAVKSVMAFQDLALSAGKFADATGLSSREASKFIEVAGDIGVEAAAVEKSIGFMNKTLGNSPELFRDLGIQIEYTSGGATDVSGTFLNVIDRLNKIEDPAKRAAAGTRLLGRSWMELSELVAMGAGGLSDALAGVSDAKIIDPEEVAKARELRASMDELRDKFEDLTLELGQKLVPAVTDAINQFLVLSDAIGKVPVLPDIFGNMLKGRPFQMAFIESIVDTGRELLGLGDETDKVTVATDEMTRVWKDGYNAMINASYGSEELRRSLANQIEEVDLAKARWDEFRSGLSIQQQTLRVQGSIEEFRTKWAGATDEMKRKSKEYQQDLLRIQIELANAALAIVGLATTAQNTQIQLFIQTGQLERALSLIGLIKAGMNTLAGMPTADRLERQLGQAVIAGGTPGTTAPPPKAPVLGPPAPKPAGLSPIQQINAANKLKNIKGIATGGTITAGGMALVGEEGPELVNLPRAASVIPSIPSRKMMGGGMTVNITVQAGLVSSPDQVGQQIIDAIRRAERRSGQVFVNA